jgi:hypothetical protein
MLFVGVTGVLVFIGLVWLAGRFVSGKKLSLLIAALIVGGGFCLLVALVAVGLRSKASAPREMEYASAPASAPPARDESEMKEQGASAGKGKAADRTGNFLAQNAAGGVLEGVTPVALALPAYERSAYASRELVTRERPFRPVLVYMTTWAMLPIGIGWLACFVALLRFHATELRSAWSRVRARLARGPAERAPQAGREGSGGG